MSWILSIWSFWQPATSVRLFHDLVVWYVVAHEGRYTRPEAGLFSPKPGVGPLSATISQ